MPEPTLAPTAAPTPEPVPVVKAPRVYAVNHGFAVLLDDSQQTNDTASAPEFAAAMQKRQITTAFLTAQRDDISSARGLMQSALSQRNAGKSGTQNKSGARLLLERLLANVQSAAAQKYLLSDPDRVRDYYYGSDIGDADTAEFKVISDGVVGELKDDDLPGIDAAEEAALEAAVEAWENEVAAGIAGSGALGTQDTLEALLKTIKGRTQITKFAADGSFPYSVESNGPIRKRFKLPERKPYRPALPKKPV